MACAALVPPAGAQLGSDANLPPVDQPLSPPATTGGAGPQQVVCTFLSPLGNLFIHLVIDNSTSEGLDALVLDGMPASIGPIVWDSMGEFVGPAQLESLLGEDTTEVSATFAAFDPGDVAEFAGVDPDRQGEPNSALAPHELAGARVTVTAGGRTASAIFVDRGRQSVAVVEFGATPVAPSSWAAIRFLYR